MIIISILSYMPLYDNIYILIYNNKTLISEWNEQKDDAWNDHHHRVDDDVSNNEFICHASHHFPSQLWILFFMLGKASKSDESATPDCVSLSTSLIHKYHCHVNQIQLKYCFDDDADDHDSHCGYKPPASCLIFCQGNDTLSR